MPFEIVVNKRRSKCQNCGRWIEKGEMKLRFTSRFLQSMRSQYDISKSCCQQCFSKLEVDQAFLTVKV